MSLKGDINVVSDSDRALLLLNALSHATRRFADDRLVPCESVKLDEGVRAFRSLMIFSSPDETQSDDAGGFDSGEVGRMRRKVHGHSAFTHPHCQNGFRARRGQAGAARDCVA